ncbi:MAG: enoyl-CoA hydratase-related protein [Thermodesulfobacteriota bacterium]
MAHQDIRFELADGVAVVTLHRPEQRNAFSGTMGVELGAAYTECDRNDDVRAVVLTGAGDAFCAGADLAPGGETFARREEKESSETGSAGHSGRRPSRPPFSAAGVEPPAFAIRKPVIAAVNGHAVGIGLTLAMQCDVRLFALEGKYGFLHVRRGVIPDAYSHWTVPRAIGFARTADLFLTGRTFRGEEAERLGIASRALPAADVLPAALEIARDIAANTAPLSVALCKRLLWEGHALSVDEVGRKETALHHVVMGEADAREGVLAFLERRAPRWQLSPTRDWPKEWPK